MLEDFSSNAKDKRTERRQRQGRFVFVGSVEDKSNVQGPQGRLYTNLQPSEKRICNKEIHELASFVKDTNSQHSSSSEFATLFVLRISNSPLSPEFAILESTRIRNSQEGHEFATSYSIRIRSSFNIRIRSLLSSPNSQFKLN
ncbi:hypothetical protein Tco_0617557 [Tanacetum coccineum]